MKRPTEEEIDLQEGSVEVLSVPEINPDTPFESQESQLVAETALHARPGSKGGRPRKDGIKPGLVDVDLPVPTPTYRVFKSDATNPNQSSRSGWNYWNSLPDWAKGKIVAYVYRDHPILLDPGFDEDEEVYNKQYKYIDKITGTEPIQDDMDLLHRYGCGTYRVVLKDASSKRKIDKPVFTVWIMNIGGSNYRSNPPTDNRINDVEQLDLDHPSNKAYVSYLRGQGKLPDQINSKVQENEMANAQLIEKLVDKVTDDRDRDRRTQPSLDEASKRAMDISAKLTESAIDTMKQVNDYASKRREEIDAAFPRNTPIVATTAPVSDPVTVAVQLIKTIQEMSGGNGSSAEVAELRNQLMLMQREETQALRNQVDKLLEAKVTTPSVATSPFSAMNDGLESLRKMKEVVDEFAGAAGEDAAAKNPVSDAIGDAAPKWVRPFIPYAPLLGQLLMGMLQSRMQPQPQPQPQYMPQGYPGGPMPGYVPPQQINAPQMMPTPQQAPVSIDNPNNLPPAVIEVLSGIKDSLAFHMHYDMTGTEFAQWYITQVGEPRYRDVAALGVEQIVQCLALYPPTASVLRNKKTEEVTEFVAEFCDPKLWEEGDDEPGTGKQPPAV